jgi:hypothetical protein
VVAISETLHLELEAMGHPMGSGPCSDRSEQEVCQLLPLALLLHAVALALPASFTSVRTYEAMDARRWLTQAREAIARAPRRRVVLPEQALIPLTGQLVRPALRHLRQPGDAAALTRRNALATFLGFSLLPDVRRPHTSVPDPRLAKGCGP